ncbi:MAG: hypothetical protein D6784_01425 [Chloroflexi bacterium]|nr:MAG: hypothetical protein D6784_01425 [Chloroflexota bacterium]
MGFWIVNTPGIGSLIVLTVGLSVFAAYVYMVRWIQTAPPDPVEIRAPQTAGEPEPNGTGGES